MQRSQHRIEIDIFKVPYRGCRQYQEAIADYMRTGRPRFQWEKMQHKYLLEGDEQIERICGACPLNILGTVEGCRIDVVGLTSLLGIVSQLRPDSQLTRFSFSEDMLSADDTRLLHREFEAINQMAEKMTWPVAQVYESGMPRRTEDSLRPFDYYELEGGADETFIYSNAGYTVAIAPDGIVVRESLAEALPERFVKLWKESANVFGQTAGGRLYPFLPIADYLPAWEDTNALYDLSELHYVELPLMSIYGDVIESILVFSTVAAQHNTGLKFNAL